MILLYFNTWRKMFHLVVMDEYDHYDETGEILILGLSRKYISLFGKTISFGR